MIDTTIGFTIVREFDATPEELWQYWTDPAEAATWWHQRGVHTPAETVTIDARVGGRYSYVMVNDDTGERYPTAGEYREVVPHERLAFTWGNPADDPDECPLITLTFAPADAGTRMTFDLRGYAGDANVFDGWTQALDILSEVSAEGRR